MKRICTVLLFFSSIVVAELFCMEKRENVDAKCRKRLNKKEEYARVYKRVIEGMRKKDENGERKLDEFISAEVVDHQVKKVILDAIFDAILEETKIAVE